MFNHNSISEFLWIYLFSKSYLDIFFYCQPLENQMPYFTLWLKVSHLQFLKKVDDYDATLFTPPDSHSV